MLQLNFQKFYLKFVTFTVCYSKEVFWMNNQEHGISFQKKLENLLWQDSRTLLLSEEAALY